MGYSEDDPESRRRLAAFTSALATHGWTEGRNLVLDVRWTAGHTELASKFAKELVALKPDAILANTTPSAIALRRETRTVPIVFVVVSDPIGSGLVETFSRPGRNVTGLVNLESSLVEKWLELLKEVAPRVKSVAMMFNPDTAPYATYYLQPLNAMAPKVGVKTFAAAVRSEAEVGDVVARLAREPGGGLIVMTDSSMFVQRKMIIALANKHKVPAIYYIRDCVDEGGLLSYGIDTIDLFKRSAGHVDRVLRGAKPADMPVELPTKFEMAVNRKTAEALGLTLPQSILLRADRVIE